MKFLGENRLVVEKKKHIYFVVSNTYIWSYIIIILRPSKTIDLLDINPNEYGVISNNMEIFDRNYSKEHYNH